MVGIVATVRPLTIYINSSSWAPCLTLRSPDRDFSQNCLWRSTLESYLHCLSRMGWDRVLFIAQI